MITVRVWEEMVLRQDLLILLVTTEITGTVVEKVLQQLLIMDVFLLR